MRSWFWTVVGAAAVLLFVRAVTAAPPPRPPFGHDLGVR